LPRPGVFGSWLLPLSSLHPGGVYFFEVIMLTPLLIPWHSGLQVSLTCWQWILTAIIPLILWKREIQYKGLATWAACLYLAACCVSTITGLDLFSSIFGLFGTHRGGLLQTGLLFLIFHLSRKDDDFRLGLSRVGLVCSLFCIVQYLGMFFFSWAAPFGSKSWGLFGSPVFSGAILAACMVAIRTEGSKNRIILILCAIGLYLTETRGPWVAVFVGLCAVHLKKKYAISIFIIASIAVMAFIYRPGAGQKEVGRQLAIELSLKGFKKRPIQGTGGDQFAFLYLSMPPKFSKKWKETYTVHFQDHAHNSFVEVLTSQGVLGAVPALILLLMILNCLESWRLGVFLSLLFYSLLNPLCLPAKAIMALTAGSGIKGQGIRRVWAVSIFLILPPLWHYSQEIQLREIGGQNRFNAAVNLGLIQRRK